jgi:hypothetical protein
MRLLYFCGVLPSGGKMLRAILFYTPAVGWRTLFLHFQFIYTLDCFVLS